MFALVMLTVLSFMTGLLRRRWLGLVVTGLIMIVIDAPSDPIGASRVVLFYGVALLILRRMGLVATSSFFVIDLLGDSPPLDFSRWYAGRAMIALAIPLALLVYGFYVSLGGKPVLGSALAEE